MSGTPLGTEVSNGWNVFHFWGPTRAFHPMCTLNPLRGVKVLGGPIPGDDVLLNLLKISRRFCLHPPLDPSPHSLEGEAGAQVSGHSPPCGESSGASVGAGDSPCSADTGPARAWLAFFSKMRDRTEIRKWVFKPVKQWQKVQKETDVRVLMSGSGRKGRRLWVNDLCRFWQNNYRVWKYGAHGKSKQILFFFGGN